MKKNFYENPLPREWAEWLAELDRDPEHQRQLAEQRAGHEFFRREGAMLRERFVHRVVAANSRGLVAHADDLDSLLDELLREGVAREEVAVQYVLGPDDELIL